jgi:hypothetical protein
MEGMVIGRSEPVPKRLMARNPVAALVFRLFLGTQETSSIMPRQSFINLRSASLSSGPCKLAYRTPLRPRHAILGPGTDVTYLAPWQKFQLASSVAQLSRQPQTGHHP